MRGSRYRPSQVFIHWSTLVLIVMLISLPYATDAYRAVLGTARNVITLHKSLGLLVLALTVVRLVLRRVHASAHDDVASEQLSTGARLGHIALYVLLLAMPLSGLLFNARPLNLFWLVQVPPLPVGEEVRHLAKAFHGYAQYVLFTLILGHAGFGLWHHHVRKDGALTGMLSAGSRT